VFSLSASAASAAENALVASVACRMEARCGLPSQFRARENEMTSRNLARIVDGIKLFAAVITIAELAVQML
jgi:hypothetical protein